MPAEPPVTTYTYLDVSIDLLFVYLVLVMYLAAEIWNVVIRIKCVTRK